MTPGIVYKSKSSGRLAFAVATRKPIEVDRGRMSVTAILSTGSADQQGDVVDPIGFHDHVHKANPVVFFDHRDSTDLSAKLPIGIAEDPSGNYTVRSVDLPDAGPALVAETYFSRKSKLAEQVFDLVSEDMLRGTSVGFLPLAENGVPVPGAVSVIRKGRGPQDRGAYHFHEWVLSEYSHTPQPVNADALTVKIEKSWGKWVPELRAKLEPYLVTKSRSTAAVRGFNGGRTVPKPIKKADPLATDPMAEAGDDMSAFANVDPDGLDMEGGGDTTPTAKAAYDGSQALMDAVAMIEEALASGEHVKGRAKIKKCLENIKAEADELSAIGDMVAADLGGGEMDDEAAVEDETPPEPVEVDDEDGAIVTKGGYKPRRFAGVTFAGDTAVIVHKSGLPPRRYTLAELTQTKSEPFDREVAALKRRAARVARELKYAPRGR